MEQQIDTLVNAVVGLLALLITTYVIPALKAKKEEAQAKMSETQIRIMEKAIESGIAFFKERLVQVTEERVLDYMKDSIPDTLKGKSEAAILRKITAEMAKMKPDIKL